MKTLIKLVIAILLSNYSFSQIYYSNYLDETSEWRIVEHHGEASFHDYYFNTVFFDGFEDIDGYTYYKMYKTFYNIAYDINYSQVVFPQSNNYTNFIGYFREDNTGKFYLKYPTENEFIYFDNQFVLNAQINDSYFKTYPVGNDFCPILSESNINILGNNYKIIYSNNDLNDGGSALEGVGMLFKYCLHPQFLDYTLLNFERIASYKKQGQTYDFYNFQITTSSVEPLYYYSFPPANHQNLNTAEINNIKVQVYPNPTSNIVSFDNRITNFSSVSIYNTIGQELKIKNLINSVNEEIDLSGFANGVYYLKFSNENSNSTIKVVKQ